MFSLFYGLWKYLFTKTEFHVLILGIDKAGKTVIWFFYLVFLPFEFDMRPRGFLGMLYLFTSLSCRQRFKCFS